MDGVCSTSGSVLLGTPVRGGEPRPQKGRPSCSQGADAARALGQFGAAPRPRRGAGSEPLCAKCRRPNKAAIGFLSASCSAGRRNCRFISRARPRPLRPSRSCCLDTRLPELGRVFAPRPPRLGTPHTSPPPRKEEGNAQDLHVGRLARLRSPSLTARRALRVPPLPLGRPESRGPQPGRSHRPEVSVLAHPGVSPALQRPPQSPAGRPSGEPGLKTGSRHRCLLLGGETSGPWPRGERPAEPGGLPSAGSACHPCCSAGGIAGRPRCARSLVRGDVVAPSAGMRGGPSVGDNSLDISFTKIHMPLTSLLRKVG